MLSQKKEKNCTYLYAVCKKCGRKKWIALKHIRTQKCCERNTNTQFKALILDEKIINNIELIEPTKKRDGTSVIWKCKCFCGNIFYTTINKLKRKRVKSCGCKKIRYSPQNLEKAMKVFKEKNLKDGTCLNHINPDRKLLVNNTSGKTGVTWSKSKKKWIAQIMFQGKSYHLGEFENIEQAIKCRIKSEEKYFKPTLDKYSK